MIVIYFIAALLSGVVLLSLIHEWVTTGTITIKEPVRREQEPWQCAAMVALIGVFFITCVHAVIS